MTFEIAIKQLKNNLFNIPWIAEEVVRRVSFLTWLNPLAGVYKEVLVARARVDFDMTHLDEKIKKFICKVANGKLKVRSAGLDPKRIGVLASVFSDSARGHVKLAVAQADLLRDEYETGLFSTNVKGCEDSGRQVLSHFSYVDGIRSGLKFSHKDAIELAQKIIDYGPVVVVSFMDASDVLGTAVMALLKEYSDIKIIYSTHASHYPNIGVSFADFVRCASETSNYVNTYLRKTNKAGWNLSSLCCGKLEDYPNVPKSRILEVRRALNLNEEELCTMSGGVAYKFFNEDGSSEYFEMIKKLLERNVNVRHFVLSDFSTKNMVQVDKIFNGSTARERLSFIPLNSNYEAYFKCADLFIDSFPVSAALTIVDLMRLRVPYVVKINRDNLLWSFHFYQDKTFKWMFESPNEMLAGIEFLLHNEAARMEQVEANYFRFMTVYEGRVAKRWLIRQIESRDDFSGLIVRPQRDAKLDAELKKALKMRNDVASK